MAKESIVSAIFLLDQKVDYKEYMDRLATIVKAFNKMTESEKLELKNWLANTLSEEIKEVALNILDADKEEVDTMTANITRTIEEMKEEAKLEGEIAIVKKMIKNGMSIEQIAELTEIDIEKLKELIEIK